MSRFRRRLMGLSALRQALKDDFVRVEYIENTSTAYIDTGIKGNNNIKIDAVILFNATAGQFVYGSRRGDTMTASGNYGYLFYTDGTSYFGTCVGTIVTKNFDYTPITNKKYHLNGTMRNLNIIFNDIDEETGEVVEKTLNIVNSGTTPASANYKNSYIFNINSKSGIAVNNALKGRVYSFKIYDGSTLVRDYIPMYQKSRDRYGLWDRVNEKFYTSPNGVKFTGGERVIADANENLYYLKNYIYINSKQTQYIILKPFTNTDKVELKVHPIGDTNYWFGDRSASGNRRLQIASWDNTRLDIAYGTQFPSITYSSGINNKDLILKLYDKKFYVNNQLLYTFTSTFNTTNNTNLGRVYNTGRGTNSRFFWFKWWNGNKDLIYDLIPVQRCSDGVWGFFDKVSLVFHPSNGTEQFTGG